MKSDVFTQAPDSWVKRLREISPIVDQMAHLRFRYFEPKARWHFFERGQWALYACTPRHLIHKLDAEQYEKHWSELSLEPEKPVPDAAQRARRASVSSYQHYMWHAHGVEAKPFMILQGDDGGTPAAYTRREKRYLDGCNALSDPLPIGFLPWCPFDERTVSAIQKRDRFIQAGKDLDALAKRDGAENLIREDLEAERVFRDNFLTYWADTTLPQAEFLKSWLRTKEAANTLPRATKAQADAMTDWQDVFREHGNLVGAQAAASRNLQVAINPA